MLPQQSQVRHGLLHIGHTFRCRRNRELTANRGSKRRRDVPTASKGKAMDEGFSDDLVRLDDLAFLAERRRVREELEHTPEHAANPELTARYQRLNEEFLRRASLAWAQAR